MSKPKGSCSEVGKLQRPPGSMQQNLFILSLPRACVGKSASRLILFERSPPSLAWKTPDPRVTPMQLMSSQLVLDPIQNLKAHFPDLMWTTESLIIPTQQPSQAYKLYEPYDHYEIPLDVQHVSEYTGELRPKLKAEVQEILTGIVDYASVAITVTSNFILHMYGTKQNIAYAQYKLFTVLNHIYGYGILRLELPISKQPLVAGPNRQHLLTIFQQTGVNVYMPPSLEFGDEVAVDEVYLTGDKVQLLVAEKLLSDVVIRKTDTLEKECVISSYVRDMFWVHCRPAINEIMLKHATFIQLPPPGTDANITRIMGTTRRSIENTIDELMKLAGSVYSVELKAHFDQSLSAQISATGVSILSTANGTIMFGLNKHVHQALKALKTSGSDEVGISVLLEQPVDLLDFILGKKQGKILKVVHGTATRITVEKFHEHNFRLRLAGDKVSAVAEALVLLEAELPAEKSLHIPEVYHKQVIGQGGLSIQQLMRKYNVYMRFANTTKENYPNAFGDSRSDNVIIRCPAKNRSQIDNAAQELMQSVEDLSRKHHRKLVRLSRNHRRLLLATQSNGLREVEVASGAAIRLPSEESRESQTVEISGQTEASTDTALSMMDQLLSQTDYEFRIPWTSRFLEIAGPRSQFCEKVSVPLFLGMNAQVQAFEKVQMCDDPTIYSQIVVSVHEDHSEELFDDISQVVTAYLRQHKLDIVEKGEIRTELEAELEPLPTLTYVNTVSTKVQSSSQGTASQGPGVSLYHSPEQHEAPISLAFLKSQSQNARLAVATSSPRLNRRPDLDVTVPKETPHGLPSRPPMTSLQWNRNFDETPVKKRSPENISEEPVTQTSTPRARPSRIPRRM